MTETHPEKRLIGYARVSTYGHILVEELILQPCAARRAWNADPDALADMS